MKTYSLLILTGCLITQLAVAQTRDLQTTNATAAEGRAGDMIISYSVGEMVLVNSATSSNLIISNGILQADNETAATSDSGGFQPGEIQVFPNPTPDQFNISFAILAPGKISIAVFDINGKKLSTEEMPYNGFTTSKYSLGKHAAGTYLLQVNFTNAGTGEKKKGVYKIIKTN